MDFEMTPTGAQAWAHFCRGEYDAAIVAYEALLADRPGDFDARMILMEIHLRRGNAAAARDTLGAAWAHLQPDQISALLWRMGRHASAFKPGLADEQLALVEMLERNPDPDSDRLHLFHATSSSLIHAELERIDAIYSAHDKFHPWAISSATAKMIYWLIRLLQPVNMVEVGSYAGYSALHMATAARHNDRGHVFALDLFINEFEAGQRMNALDFLRGNIERLGLADYVTPVKGDSSTELTRLAGHIDKADLVFIDGDHLIKGCLADLAAADSIIDDDSIILLHDTSPKGSGWLGPEYCLDQLKRRFGDKLEMINLPTDDGYGLAMIRRGGLGGSPMQWRVSVVDLILQRIHHLLRPGA